MPTMKAIRIHDYGDSGQMRFEDAPVPTPGEGEILVRVHAAGVNPVDWKIREGLRRQRFEYAMPLILGWDLSGTVEALGPGCEGLGFAVGQEVFGKPDLARDGAYAEYTVVRPVDLAAKPASLDHRRAAAVPLAAQTAWQALLVVGELSAGQRVLIHAAAGGVGLFAVQLAKWKGAEVVATASARHHVLLSEFGADEIIDYTQVPFERATAKVDLVFDTLGGETRRRSWPLIAPGGSLVTITTPPEPDEAPEGLRAHYHFVQSDPRQLARIAGLIDDGTLKVHVERSYPLARAVEALDYVQAGHTQGKVVLEIA